MRVHVDARKFIPGIISHFTVQITAALFAAITSSKYHALQINFAKTGRPPAGGSIEAPAKGMKEAKGGREGKKSFENQSIPARCGAFTQLSRLSRLSSRA